MTTSDTTVAALPLAGGTWTLDDYHSQVTFAVRHLGIAKVRGRFQRFDATLEVGDTADDVRVTATIDLDSIDTGNADRDAHVRGPDLLDTAAHPTLEFRSTRISGAAAAWAMEGELTTHGVTRPVTLDVEFNGTSDGLGRLQAGFSASGSLSRKDHGIDFGPAINAGLGDKVTFDIDLEFVAPGAAAAAE
jgi:polyisoprenoid-binding protein YceI